MNSLVSLQDDLKQWFHGAQRIIIIGVGNPIRRDDNVGVQIVGGLKGRVPEYVSLIESETIPEGYIEQIVDFKPTHIMMIDAALLSLVPGSARLVKSIEAPSSVVSTHFLPIQIFCQSLVEMTGAKIAMLLVQPKDTGFGEGLSPELASTKRKLVNNLVRIIKSVEN
jgi:hydrogenase 3 maturation protease